MSEVRLTGAERDDLADAVMKYQNRVKVAAPVRFDRYIAPAVEAILAARLAAVETECHTLVAELDRLELAYGVQADLLDEARATLTAPPEAVAPTSGEVGL